MKISYDKKKNGTIEVYDEAGNKLDIYPKVETDTTLTKSNVAADAYEVGARFKEADNTVNAKFEDVESRVNTKLEETQSAIETVSQIAKGANQALSYESYETMITALNAMSNAVLKKGQNIYIGTVGVPDLWIFSVEEISSEYTFVDDNTLVNLLKENVAVQIGYYKVAMLETQKVDLSEYAKTADINTKINQVNTNLNERTNMIHCSKVNGGKDIYFISAKADTNVGTTVKIQAASQYAALNAIVFSRYGIYSLFANCGDNKAYSTPSVKDIVGSNGGHTVSVSNGIIYIKTTSWETINMICSCHSNFTVSAYSN